MHFILATLYFLYNTDDTFTDDLREFRNSADYFISIFRPFYFILIFSFHIRFHKR
jgi:hypothetical protein